MCLFIFTSDRWDSIKLYFRIGQFMWSLQEWDADFCFRAAENDMRVQIAPTVDVLDTSSGDSIQCTHQPNDCHKTIRIRNHFRFLDDNRLRRTLEEIHKNSYNNARRHQRLDADLTIDQQRVRKIIVVYFICEFFMMNIQHKHVIVVIHRWAHYFCFCVSFLPTRSFLTCFNAL